MKKLLAFFLLISIPSQSQSFEGKNEVDNYVYYFTKVYKADSLYVVKNYRQSFLILDKLFQDYEPLNQDLIYEMETYIDLAYKVGENNKIVPILKKLISKWGFEYKYLNEEVKTYVKLKNSELEKLQNEYKNRISWKLRDSILKMNKYDQFYRKKGNNFFKSKEDSLIKINEIDKNHYKAILSIFKSGISLDKTVIGNRTRKENSSIEALLIHCIDEDKDNQLKNIVYRLLLKGKIIPIEYAVMVDRERLNNKLQQKFGSFSSISKLSDNDIRAFNINRSMIGLHPIGYQKWRMKILYKQ